MFKPSPIINRLRRMWQKLRLRSATPAPDRFATASGSFGGVAASQMEQDEEANVPFPEPFELEIEDVFDLHTVQPREAQMAVEAYLREAYQRGFHSVRIIHGKGRGVQRAMVHRVLSRTPFVAAWTDAPPDAGGWGATVVHFRRTNTP